MKIAVFDDYRLGVVVDEHVVDVTPLLPDVHPAMRPHLLAELISRYGELRERLLAPEGRTLPLKDVRLRAACPAPRNFLAAPLNYVDHGAEMLASTGSTATAKELGFFVKAAGSLSGASDDLELPDLPGRRFDHEGEIGVVIGRAARGVSRDDALDHVFGYTVVVDATMRMTETQREERTFRKSFATFGPCGPWIVTADEAGDPAEMQIQLSVNGELRQDGALKDLIVDVPGLIEQASAVLPLQPGDLIATGTPVGVGELHPADEVVVTSPQIGSMNLTVRRRAW
jgi:2-keto-4-pentenoate hydratase/2-oxohepta-3-ene-1,7-dioic acid hydratase in catechol pathway